MVAIAPTLPILAPPTRPARRTAAAAFERLDPPGGGDLIAALLAEQSKLTAVERFARAHGEFDRPSQERYYKALLPASPPGVGQQYAFEVDLDLCTGCKGCVTACHNLNGLDDGEAWRDVGLLHGGTPEAPVVQHVTTACHHCLDPACAKACPVDAYEKDPATGIVRHLDDQCFGCQYCTLACPYDVPKYHEEKGVVRKCDLCAGRLAAGEAPACVQACPHGAIRVAVVDAARVAGDRGADAFLPGAPEPGYTLPTTTFKTRRPLPRDLLPADDHDVKPEHAHRPLVVMLVLSQLSVGAFVAQSLLHAGRSQAAEVAHAAASLAFGLLALAAGAAHLGRPHLAFRAVIGLRHSWLSREAVAFGAFAPLAVLHAGLAWLDPDGVTAGSAVRAALAGAVALTGLAGVGCGVMVYHVVRRPFWHAGRSGARFLGTTAVLGLAAALLTLHAGAAVDGRGVASAQVAFGRGLALAVAAVAAAKLLIELEVFAHLRDDSLTPLRRTAVLMTGPLAGVTAARFLLGGVGGLVLPLLIRAAGPETAPGLIVAGSSLSFVALLVGELAERYLFFTAVVRQKMPGGLAI